MPCTICLTFATLPMHMSDATILATELARAVYRLTDELPETEPLRIKLREVALDIAAGNSREVSLSIQAMSRLLHVAEAQGFAREENFVFLDREYRKLENFERRGESVESGRFELPVVNRGEPSPINPPTLNDAFQRGSTEFERERSDVPPLRNGESNETKLKKLNARQKKIIQHFHYRQAFQLRDARALFEGYSQKTLRNDLRDLCLKGILSREGVGTTSFYRVAVKVPNT